MTTIKRYDIIVNNIEKIKSYINSNNIDKRFKNHYENPLMFACRLTLLKGYNCNIIEIIKFLLNKGANV